MKTLGLILARGGSRGIPRKNLRTLAGKPLIVWTIEAALAAKGIDAVVVSTEDAEIARVAREAGAQVPFMRPAALAADDSTSLDAALHALDQLREFAWLMLLQPTSPLRTAADIEACIEVAHDTGAPSVVSLAEARDHPYLTHALAPDGRLMPFVNAPAVSRRQDMPAAYAENGAMYYTRADSLRAHRAWVTPESVAYVMPPERSIDLDTLLDWQVAELLLRQQVREQPGAGSPRI